jgi:hypothetical protein
MDCLEMCRQQIIKRKKYRINKKRQSKNFNPSDYSGGWILKKVSSE